MTGAVKKSRRGRIKKWLRRALIVGALAAAAALAVPFVFTGAIVRYFLARSDYRDLPLHFRSASLSPWGSLTLRDVDIRDTGESAGKPLLAASAVHLDFGWRDVLSNHLHLVAVDDMDVSIRPGADVPVTLMRLLSATPASDGTGGGVATISAPPAASPGTPWSVDQFVITGHVRVEGFEPWLSAAQLHAGEAIPVQLAASTKGASPGWAYAISLTAGETDSPTHAGLKARLNTKTAGGITTITADQITLQNIQPELSQQINARWPTLPAELRLPTSGHLEQLSISGTATCSSEISINAGIELRNLTEHPLQPDPGVPRALENFSASARVAGKISGTPLKDLTFTNAHCTWDSLQYGELRLQKGIADFEVSGAEIVLKDLSATYLGTPIAATAAYDTDAGLLSRGRIWVNNFSAPDIRERLPEAIRRQLPEGLVGTLSARVFLSESTHDHIAAHVELAGDDQLGYYREPPAKPVTAENVPDLALQHFTLSGTVSWNYRPDSPPEISHGRFLADDFLIYSSTPNTGIDIGGIKADFTYGGGNVQLVDFYADLPGEGDGGIYAEGAYAIGSGSVESGSLSIHEADLSLLNPWLAAPATGLFSIDVEGKGSPQSAEGDIAISLSPELTLETKGPHAGTLSLASASGSSFHLHTQYDRQAGTLKIDHAQITDFGKIQADADFVAWLHKQSKGNDTLAAVLNSMAPGATASLDKASFDGTISLHGHGEIDGAISLEGLDAHIQGDAVPLDVKHLSAGAELVLPLGTDRRNDVRITKGHASADLLAFADREISHLSTQFEVAGQNAEATGLHLVFDEGTFDGGASGLLSGKLNELHLAFRGVNQKLLTEGLYPNLFTAEGGISGSLTLGRKVDGALTGSIQFAGDAPGRLKVSRDVSKQAFASVAKAAAGGEGTMLPDNFDQIVVDQLADYPYQTGQTVIEDGPGGMRVTMNYDRVPLKKGEPGYAATVTVGDKKLLANLEFNLKGASLTVNNSITDLLTLVLGFSKQVTTPVRPPAGTVPSTGP